MSTLVAVLVVWFALAIVETVALGRLFRWADSSPRKATKP